ncbi:MAG: CPBP family intramembrane metalloprotease [Kiritimatiellaeota bacterium]|nr:CPBP family intramembrane metalloprotease [Kiritimatiellota bacterium]
MKDLDNSKTEFGESKGGGDFWIAVAAASVPVTYVFGQFYIIRSTALFVALGCGKLFLTVNQVFASQLFMLFGVVGTAVLFGKTSDFLRVGAFVNWRKWFIPLAVGLELCLFVPFAVFSFLSLSLVELLKPMAPDTMDAMLKLSQALQKFLLESDWSVFCVVAFAAVVVAPIVEEIVFRGVIFNYLARRWGVLGALFATSFIFAVFHLNAVSFLVLFSLGIVLQTLYVKTKSIFSCMLFHSAHNAIAIGLLLIYKLGIFGKGAETVLR